MVTTTITAFLQRTPIYSLPDAALVLLQGRWLPEVGYTLNWASTANVVKDKRITIPVLVESQQVWSHAKAPWRLAAVLFDGTPCMIIRNRDSKINSDRYPTRFVVDKDVYRAMLWYCLSLMQEDTYVNQSVEQPDLVRPSKFTTVYDTLLEIDEPPVYDLSLCDAALRLTLP